MADLTIPTRPLGATGVDVSILALGGGHLSRRHIEPETSIRIIQEAVDSGVSFMDNAWEYWGGESERRMGAGLKGRRQQVTLMTKVCARDRATALEQLEESLQRLQTDVIDVWQFHEINYDNDPEMIFAAGGAIEAADEAKRAGKVRFVGFTGHKSPHILLKMLEQDYPWDTCQMPVNVMDAHYRSFQQLVLPEFNRRRIGCLGMKSLGGEAQMLDSGLSAEQCRRYAMSLPISTLITGVESFENLRQDVGIARDFEPYTAAEMAELQTRVVDVAGDGRYEWFKSTQYFDSQYHRDQHGFPPIRHVSAPAED